MRKALALAVVGVLALSGAASAHVRLDKKSVTADTIAALQLRVPGEEPESGTVKVVLEVPAGFTATSCKPKAGWTCAITADATAGRSGLVTWSGRSAPEAVDLFTFNVRVPNKNGSYAFEVNQFYADGDVAHWDQKAGEDHPAAVLSVTGAKAASSPRPVATTAAATPSVTVSPAPSARADEPDDGPDLLLLGIPAALVLLVAGGAVLIRRRTS